MKLCLLVCCALLCLIQFCSSRQTDLTVGLEPTDLERWRQEIDLSLQRNIRGTCKVRVIDNRSTLGANSSEEFLIYRVFPSKHEVDKFRQLPPTLTLSDENIRTNAAKRGYNHEEWLKIPVPRWEIPANHIGQNHSFCLDMVALSATGRVVSFYESFRAVHRTLYVAQVQQAIIHPSGSIWARCGYFMGQENCETRWDYAKKWHAQCLDGLRSLNRDWRDFWSDSVSASEREKMIAGCTDPTDLGVINNLQKPLVSYHDKVFVISALWDYNYHHWIADSLPRLVRHLHFLRAHPSVKIHIRHFEDYDMAYRHNSSQAFKDRADLMRERFFDLLGLDRSRFVTGLVVAKEVYLPRNMRCAWALSNPLELRLLARHLHATAISFVNNPANKELTRAWGVSVGDVPQSNIEEKDAGSAPQKTIIVLQRLSGDTSRSWTNETFEAVVSAFRTAFPTHRVLPLPESRASQPNYCLACDVALFSQADVLVGEHGAGLTNMMFMPKGSLIVELAGAFKDVNMPICGYYGTFASIFGHHHYLHSYDHNQIESITPLRAAQGAAGLYQKVHSPRAVREVGVIRVDRTPVSP